MPTNHRRSSPTNASVTLSKRLARLEIGVGKLTGTRVNVRREEDDEVVAALNQLQRHTAELERHTRELDTQFQRLAQLQAEFDGFKRAWEKSPV